MAAEAAAEEKPSLIDSWVKLRWRKNIPIDDKYGNNEVSPEEELIFQTQALESQQMIASPKAYDLLEAFFEGISEFEKLEDEKEAGDGVKFARKRLGNFEWEKRLKKQPEHSRNHLHWNGKTIVLHKPDPTKADPDTFDPTGCCVTVNTSQQHCWLDPKGDNKRCFWEVTLLEPKNAPKNHDDRMEFRIGFVTADSDRPFIGAQVQAHKNKGRDFVTVVYRGRLTPVKARGFKMNHSYNDRYALLFDFSGGFNKVSLLYNGHRVFDIVEEAEKEQHKVLPTMELKTPWRSETKVQCTQWRIFE